MSAKLFLQILLTLGCLALAVALVDATVGLGRSWAFSPVGWWRGGMACWMLVVAIRMVYRAQAKWRGPTAIPEPASPLLLGTGLVGLARWRKRRQRYRVSERGSVRAAMVLGIGLGGRPQ